MTAALTVTLLPGTAAAEPGRATSPEQAAQLVAEASHQLEVVQEQVNTAREELALQQAAVTAAEADAAAAQQQLDSLDGQIRQLAHSAYTGGDQNLRALDVMLTSDSAEDFLTQLGTLEAIAGHTTEAIEEVAEAAAAAEDARGEADAAAAEAQQTLDAIEAQEAELQADIADYQEQYDQLTAAQQQQVAAAHGSESLAAPAVAPAAAPAAGGSAAAQTAVSTALAQVGDPYVWGAGGPNSFDCSGLTQYAYAAAGISLPHSSSMQSRMGTPVSRDALQPGDLIFFYSPVSHVAMYIGNGQMVHASTSGQPVKVVSVGSMPGFNSARRIA
ncbi:NlpC/P60 family protein [Blastococcus sp. SYSU D00669]